MLTVGRIERPDRRRRAWNDDLPRGPEAEVTLRDAAEAEAVAQVDELRKALATALNRASAAERRCATLEDRLRCAWRAAVSRWP